MNDLPEERITGLAALLALGVPFAGLLTVGAGIKAAVLGTLLLLPMAIPLAGTLAGLWAFWRYG